MRLLYRRNDLTAALPLGRLQSHALPFEGYRLAFPRSLLASVYKRSPSAGAVEDLIPSAELLTVMTAAGYVRTNDLKADGRFPTTDADDDWWIPSGHVFYSTGRNDQPVDELTEAQDHFFLARRYHDPFDQAMSIDYDPYDLLPQETRDAADNTVTAGRRSTTGSLLQNGNDYRVLQPRLVMDANRNRSEVVYDALGLVVATAVRGKPNQLLGDTLQGVTIDLADAVIASDLQDPLLDPHSLLQQATTRLVYDLFAYVRTQGNPQPQPVVIHALARETHAADLAPGQKTRIQHGISYSDGFGREVQRKLRAEPDRNGAERWVGTGWTIFNNKGAPVRQYEPFFTATHGFEFAKVVGVSSTALYDPLGRVRATLHPNHTFKKVVVDPWCHRLWDVNDTVGIVDPAGDADVGPLIRRIARDEYRPTWRERAGQSTDPAERAAASSALEHADTPTSTWFDALGRVFLTVAHNRFRRGGVLVEERYRTRVDLDIEGNQRTLIDPIGRVVKRTDFDVLGNATHTASMDAGDRWTLPDVRGRPARSWDSRGHRLVTDYDVLRRPTEVRLKNGTAPEVVVEQTVYGEARARCRGAESPWARLPTPRHGREADNR